MISLTFGEQVKIVLSRKGMTIKELAEQIEERTGKKMSRQNLTQRLGRDNFQEQDMRMIADILGCSFQLSILASAEAAERASVIEEELPTGPELDKLAAKKEKKVARAEAKAAERELTVGEVVDMLAEHVDKVEEIVAEEEPVVVPEEIETEEIETEAVETELAEEAAGAEIQEAVEAEAEETVIEVPVTEATEPVAEEDAVESESVLEETAAPADEESVSEVETEEPVPTETAPEVNDETVEEPAPAEEGVQPKEEKKESRFSKITRMITSPKREEKRYEKSKDFQPIKKRADEDEDLVNGDVNPYTGHEYQSNSVRMHPKRIGYVQVYDRKDHKWTDMTEWAFLGFEERKKATQGKDYKPPIYLD